MKTKALLWFAPLGLVSAIAAAGCWNWQQSVLARPDYDHPTASAFMTSQQSQPMSKPARVVEVIDGNTLKVKQDDQDSLVRLCGINAPDLGKPLGKASRDFVQSLLQSVQNQVILVGSARDRQGRSLAEVFIAAQNPKEPSEEKVINAELLMAGLAYRHSKFADACPNAAALARAEDIARQKRVGLWANSATRQP